MSDVPTFRRADLEQFFGSNPRLLAAFERQSAAVEEASNGVADTQAMKDATVIVLSGNGDFTNERVLHVGEGIQIDVTDDKVTLSVENVARTQDHGVTFVPQAEALLFLPPDGTLLSDTTIALLGNYASDAAAAAGGVAIGELYHNAGVIHLRLT